MHQDPLLVCIETVSYSLARICLPIGWWWCFQLSGTLIGKYVFDFDTEIFQWHDDVIKWKHFPRYWPFVRGIHRSPVNSPHKGQWRGALMLSLICVWINGWVNSLGAGDLRRYRANYDVTVMRWAHGFYYDDVMPWKRFPFCWWNPPFNGGGKRAEIRSFDGSFVHNLNQFSNKQSSCLCFETQSHSCGVTVIYRHVWDASVVFTEQLYDFSKLKWCNPQMHLWQNNPMNLLWYPNFTIMLKFNKLYQRIHNLVTIWSSCAYKISAFYINDKHHWYFILCALNTR